MAYTEEELHGIFHRTSGYCHICHGRLALRNYGVIGARGAWEVEHSNPRALGGTDRLNNLYAAHIPCNRRKGATSTRSARGRHGISRAPLSTAKANQIKTDNALLGAAAGATIGAAAGPPGMLFGALIGACMGYEIDPHT